MDKDQWKHFGCNSSTVENSTLPNYHTDLPKKFPQNNSFVAPPFFMYPNPYMAPHPRYGSHTTIGTDRDTASPNSQRSSFSSQFSPTGLDRVNLAADFEATEVPSSASAAKKNPYSFDENALLVSCWLDISTDSVIGNDQKSEQMWIRIADAYNNNRSADMIFRSPAKLKSHYYTLQKHAKWFNCCYNQEKKAWGSGCSDADIVENAKVQFKEKYGFNFVQIKAWEVLKDSPKFADPDCDVRGSKKSRVSTTGEYVVSSNTDSEHGEEASAEPPRPMGRNAARRTGKGKGKAATSVGESDDTIQKRLHDLDELNKKKIEGIASLARAKNYKILMKDTSKMTDDQLSIHLHVVDQIKKEMGL